MKNFIAFLFIFICVGCASTSAIKIPAGVGPNKIATLHIYRTDTTYHMLNPEKPYFYLDDNMVAKLGTGDAQTIKVVEGKHSISVKQPIMFVPSFESDRLVHNFKGGQEYYIRYSKEFSGVRIIGSVTSLEDTSNLYLTSKENYVNRK